MILVVRFTNWLLQFCMCPSGVAVAHRPRWMSQKWTTDFSCRVKCKAAKSEVSWRTGSKVADASFTSNLITSHESLESWCCPERSCGPGEQTPAVCCSNPSEQTTNSQLIRPLSLTSTAFLPENEWKDFRRIFVSSFILSPSSSLSFCWTKFNQRHSQMKRQE